MASVNVFNASNNKVGEVSLDDAVFGAEVKEHLLHSVVRYQMAKRRQGTHRVKGRSEISGGGRKPFRQKGTGRARQGTTRAAQMRGGGIVFGPKPRSHAFKLNKKVRRAALCSALSKRVAEGKLTVIDDLALPEAKTKQVVDMMRAFDFTDMLVVCASDSENTFLSARNIASVTVVPPEGVNVYDVLRRGNLVISKDALEAVTSRLQG